MPLDPSPGGGSPRPEGDSLTRLQRRGALLRAMLRREQRGLRARIVAWGLVRMAAAVGILLVALAGLSGLAPALPRPAGLVVAVACWAGLGFVLWRHLLRPLRAVPNLAVFARLVEERRDFRDLLRAGLEFSQRPVAAGQSLDLVAATVDRAYDEASALHLTQLFEFPYRARAGVVAGVGLLSLALIGGLSPGAPVRALQGLAFAWPTPDQIVYGRLEVRSGDPTVLAGYVVDLVVREHGPRGPEMQLRFNDTGDLWKSRVLEPQGAGDTRDYVFRLDDVRADLVYRFESGRRRTEEHRVRVAERPVVGRLQLRLVPPAYTGRPAAMLEEGRGDAVALVGTRIEVEAGASTPLAQARIVPDGAPAGAVTLSGPLPMQTDGRTARAAFLLRGDLRWHFELVDSLGHGNADPIQYQLSAIADQAPWVEIREPGGDADLPKSLRVPIAIHAADDFGLASATLVYRRERDGEDLDEPWRRRDIPVRGGGATDGEGRPLAAGPVTDLLQRFEWSLEDAGLYPGDWVTYWVEVIDNDDFSGRKTARSNSYRLRLPTLSELYADLREQDENRKSEIDEALEKGRQLQEKYEELARELRKQPEVDWKKQKEIESALEKQKELAQQVDKIAEDLAKEVGKMQEQQAVSREIAAKMDEIRKLMEQVQDETLREYMQRLQEAMRQISPEELQRAMEKMELSQEEFLKRLERTKSLLEQLAREQRLDEMIERVAELLRQQEDLNEKSNELEAGKESQSKDAESQKAEKQQGELSEEAAKLQQELEKLAQESSEAGQQQLEEPNRELQEENPSGEMREAAKQLGQKQPSEAQPHQQNATESLRGLYEQLMQAQAQMSMSAQAEAGAAMQRAARQALDVSFRQEGVARGAPLQPDPAGHGDIAAQQQALVAATGRIAEDLDSLAKKSLAAPPQVTALLGEAMGRMQEGVRAYEKGNPLGGRLQGEQAYGLLNRAVVELSRSASSSCQNPGGMGSSGQRMEEMMGRQQGLNDRTRQFRERLRDPANPSAEERAEMMRLLGEQAGIEKELQDIERQSRESRELLGRMDKMQEEMREVIEDMESESLTDETLRVQERIVSRMLDAQRSLHKRDFNEERESRTAGEELSRGGKPLPEGERARKLRRDIERALREGTPEEYESLVREYFRAIQEMERGATPAVPVP